MCSFVVTATFQEFLATIVDDERGNEFCFERGLFKCGWFCARCQTWARLIRDAGFGEGVAWRCPGCYSKLGIRAASFVKGSKLGTRLCLEIAYLWAEEWGEEAAARECGVSLPTISEHFQRFGAACLQWGLAHQVAIGGPSQTVEIDESQLTRKAKEGVEKWFSAIPGSSAACAANRAIYSPFLFPTAAARPSRTA